MCLVHGSALAFFSYTAQLGGRSLSVQTELLPLPPRSSLPESWMVIYLTDPLPVDMSILLLEQGTFPQGMGSEPALGQPGQMKPLPGLLCPTPPHPSEPLRVRMHPPSVRFSACGPVTSISSAFWTFPPVLMPVSYPLLRLRRGAHVSPEDPFPDQFSSSSLDKGQGPSAPCISLGQNKNSSCWVQCLGV